MTSRPFSGPSLSSSPLALSIRSAMRGAQNAVGGGQDRGRNSGLERAGGSELAGQGKERSLKRRRLLQSVMLGGCALPVAAGLLRPFAARAAQEAGHGGGTPTTGVNGDQGYESAGSFEVVADFYGPGPSGVVVTDAGRIFVGFPRPCGEP